LSSKDLAAKMPVMCWLSSQMLHSSLTHWLQAWALSWNLSWNVLKLDLGPEIRTSEIRTYILKIFTRFHNFFKNTHHFICNMA